MKRFENLLENALAGVTASEVRSAMHYSLLSGGKRIRPRLLYEVMKGYGFPEEKGDHAACAIEMIHTYSLIHDDLPAMDNDDLRRGRPTCHKQFDEATAILAGDGLLTQAFAEASRTEASPEAVVQIIQILAAMAGADGMVYGQCLDMAETAGITGWEELKKVHRYKTGCLLSAPLMIASILCGRSDQAEKWHRIGNTIGLAFQVQDDILDVISTPEQLGKTNSDDRNGKVTSVSLFGIEEAGNIMHDLYEAARSAIGDMEGFEAGSLNELLREIENRQK